MSKSPLRKDKTCLNCRYVVENRFCSNCGQENTDTRKTFYHLFIHFIEDLTHYENAFWKTIKNLLFKPSALTKEYLSGKRLSYLAPVRLYIFISFITFFLITVFPNKDSELLKIQETKAPTNTKQETKEEQELFNFGYASVKELDSIQKNAPESKKLSDFNYWINKKIQTIREHNTNKEILEKFVESFLHNLPKVLFVFMPFFAFFLWLFHNKKRWYYFDHGIFTLHYFSFLLLLFLILFLTNKFLSSFEKSGLISFILGLFNFIGFSWMVYYFFPAHHRFYGETRFVSFLKSSLLFIINFIIVLLIITIFAVYTFINLK
ncbi:DUF3667 domain-containing protein [Flavobacterium granuli]|uniref:Uncharacterized protein DUF3667 n=1 Tax=Flavobacterium granuli TaxID=280093 RepID=A0A1M5LYR8_9FLAO|nr:DUF3667 domain-containing protein [Flavobacterium granuli]PRZ24153.1 uncharacterized protein DUF3667 [Flavobacterium granuli]SHG70207.1 Protein of unknown function [Flavobacterium granuli]